MRALVVHAGNISGGVEQVVTSWVRLTRAHGDIDLEIALAFEGPVATGLRDAGAVVHVFGPVRASRPLSVWQARRRLARVVKDVEPDVVLTQSVWSLGLFGGVADRHGVPVAHWVHDTLTGTHWTERLAARRHPHLLVCNSEYTARCAAAVFPGIRRVVVYPPGCRREEPDESRATLRARLRTPSDSVVIAQVGRTDPLKGHQVLVEALGRLAENPRWTCWQIGGPQHGPEAKYWAGIQRLVGEHSLDERVRFLGQSNEVRAILAAADVYCQPNVGPESFGLTLVEAMRAGLPVVTSDLGAASEVLRGTENVLVPPADPAALSAALERLIDDEASRRRLGMQGPDRARALTDPASAHTALLEALTGITRTARRT